ncbi:hypothetical protein [Acidithiobacillus sp.]|nr:hypothetical protein [Acidithiobacillus sp.]MCK9188455.1 hypothetical protein [Acidithiobacillus sp.]
MTEIIQAGGEIWAEGDRLKFRDTPARLIPLIREHKAALLALLTPPSPAKSTADTAQPMPMQHRADMPPQTAPAPVYCRDCARFQPGIQKLSVGACLASVTGPPSGGVGYKACYPMAPRTCPSYERNVP